MVPFGVFVPQGWLLDLVDISDPEAKYEAMTGVAREAERLGFDSIWLYDHFHTYPVEELEITFESWVTTAALARDTSRIRIGQMVTGNGYRNPALLAKMASTVDVLSHGRLNFGIGAGWYQPDYLGYGFEFPTTGERLNRLAEAIQVIRALWTQPYASFDGRYYKIRRAINEPKGIQKPHPPLWIGGGGERVTLKLVAQYGNACNISGPNPGLFRRKFQVLRQHCETVGRDYDTILRSAEVSTILLLPGQNAEEVTARPRSMFSKAQGREITLEEYREENFVGTPLEAIELYRSLIDAGVQYFIITLYNVVHLETLRLFAEQVLPAFRD